MRVGTVKKLCCPSCKTSFSQFIRTDEQRMPECELCCMPMEIVEQKRQTWSPFTPYYNKQLDQTFHTADEERSFAKKRGLVDIRAEIQGRKAGRNQW